MAREQRPPDEAYFEHQRTELFSQGDIFRDVPLAYPNPADELVVDEEDDAERHGRRFLSGPFDVGPALLVTPTCSMRGQGGDPGYAHPVRSLVPLRPMEDLVGAGAIKDDQVEFVRGYDPLINYMYVPPLRVDELDFQLPESIALLYMPVTLHHEMIEAGRVAQLAYDGAQHLHRKLVRFVSGWEEGRDFFDPPMD